MKIFERCLAAKGFKFTNQVALICKSVFIGKSCPAHEWQPGNASGCVLESKNFSDLVGARACPHFEQLNAKKRKSHARQKGFCRRKKVKVPVSQPGKNTGFNDRCHIGGGVNFSWYRFAQIEKQFYFIVGIQPLHDLRAFALHDDEVVDHCVHAIIRKDRAVLDLISEE